MRALAPWWLALALLGGCTYTVRLQSLPDGAAVLLPDGSQVLTPAVASFRHGRQQLVRVESPGYQPLVVDMQRTEGPVLRFVGGAIFQKGGREVTFVLIENHPLTGGEEAPVQP